MKKNKKSFRKNLEVFLSLCFLLFLALSLNSCFDKNKKESNSKSKADNKEKVNNKSNGAYSEFLVPGKPNVFAFFMEACPACRETKPVFDEIASNYSNNLSVKRFIFEKDQEIIKDLGVTSFPTIIFFNENGKQVKTMVGKASQVKLKEAFEEFSGASKNNIGGGDEFNNNTSPMLEEENKNKEEHQDSIRTQDTQE